jgi:hypothetical protein
MIDLTLLIVAARFVAFGVGLVVTYAAVSASRRTGSVALRLLAAGAAAVTLSTVVGGLLDTVLGVRLEVGVLVSSLLLVVGFSTLAYSLFVSDPALGRGDELAASDGRHGN